MNQRRLFIASCLSLVVTAMNDSGVGAAVYNGDQPGVMVNFEDEYYAFELNVP